MTARTCGSCQLCCKLMPMSGDNAKARHSADLMIQAGMAKPFEFLGMVPEIAKAAGVRCEHQRHGKGCAIYDKRPFSCRMWSCRWLVQEDAAALRRPDHSHYVLDLVPDVIRAVFDDGSPPVDIHVVQIWVDPKYPDAHRDPALRAYLLRLGEQGIASLVRYSSDEGFTLLPPNMTAEKEWREQTGSMTREPTWDRHNYEVTIEEDDNAVR